MHYHLISCLDFQMSHCSVKYCCLCAIASQAKTKNVIIIWWIDWSDSCLLNFCHMHMSCFIELSSHHLKCIGFWPFVKNERVWLALRMKSSHDLLMVYWFCSHLVTNHCSMEFIKKQCVWVWSFETRNEVTIEKNVRKKIYLVLQNVISI